MANTRVCNTHSSTLITPPSAAYSKCMYSLITTTVGANIGRRLQLLQHSFRLRVPFHPFPLIRLINSCVIRIRALSLSTQPLAQNNNTLFVPFRSVFSTSCLLTFSITSSVPRPRPHSHKPRRTLPHFKLPTLQSPTLPTLHVVRRPQQQQAGPNRSGDQRTSAAAATRLTLVEFLRAACEFGVLAIIKTSAATAAHHISK